MKKTLILTCELIIEEKDWFYSHVLRNDLVLHSNDIGDSLGDFKILDVKEVKK